MTSHELETIIAQVNTSRLFYSISTLCNNLINTACLTDMKHHFIFVYTDNYLLLVDLSFVYRCIISLHTCTVDIRATNIIMCLAKGL